VQIQIDRRFAFVERARPFSVYAALRERDPANIIDRLQQL
jgi:hypothetical protein